MKNGFGKLLAIFFAACFLALQFHSIGDTQLQQSVKRIFHIEEASSSVIDKSIDTKFIYSDVFLSKHDYLSQQKNTLKQQRQFIGALERLAEHGFRQFMQGCLAAFCLDYQAKLTTSFDTQQKLALSFDPSSILLTYNMQIHGDESDFLFS
ncbi:hypothetical protein [uncultured Paraglaciecola sp.]|uniref:hypothetical protein n=1 Tax=uncultured Paraglaciecola sp. TaxID=1765024 RepID=UPI0030DB8D05|tara:strand:- start:191807 stop:192259 length:453 start_codon:yes stop_codon:yes gene_type:complete